MARKQIKTVHLERQPHHDARQRLHLAYTYLIEESQVKKMNSSEEEKTQAYQEAYYAKNRSKPSTTAIDFLLAMNLHTS